MIVIIYTKKKKSDCDRYTVVIKLFSVSLFPLMLARVISPGSLCESGAVMKISVRDIYITKIDALVFHETGKLS